jgi:hypothetical protein
MKPNAIESVSICIEYNAVNLGHIKFLKDNFKKISEKDINNLLFRIEEIQEELRKAEGALT